MAGSETTLAETSQSPAMASELEAAPPSVGAAADVPQEEVAPPPDHKRKLDEIDGGEAKADMEEEEGADAARKEVVGEGEEAAEAEAKRPRVDVESDGSGAIQTEVLEFKTTEALKGEPPIDGSVQPSSEVNVTEEGTELSREDGIPLSEQHFASGSTPEVTSLKIEVPNNKVGVLIGKAGETIKFMQISSGAKIQIARDAEADPNSSSRPVELTGSLENIKKAEQLIKAVIAEADAGGSPALIARGFGTAQSGAEQVEMQVPNDKVGLVIGKGGGTIKSMQTRSGARIQLIPQHLPDGDLSKERTIRLTGNNKQIEAARSMIMEAINQVPRSGSHMGQYGSQNYRPCGPGGAPQWGPHPHLGGADNYHQRGMYPENSQYIQPHGGYSQQAPPRSGMGAAGWDQQSGAPSHAPHQGGGYNYYSQGGNSYGAHTSGGPGGAPVAMNNYGQPLAPSGYGPPPNYTQSTPGQHSYGHGYGEPKYNNHMQGQQYYGQQPMNSQPGYPSYPPQQEPYGKPAYGGPPQPYGPPRPTQQGDPMYQGPPPTQQPYTQGSSAPSQPGPGYNQPYGPAPGGADGYMQPGYQQPSGQVAPGYGQSAQSSAAYPQQGVQSGSYGHYPSAQPGYTDPAAANNANYGNQGVPTDAAAYSNNQPDTGYGSAPGGSQADYGQVGYAQPPANPAGYEQQSMPLAQAAYGTTQQASYGGA